MIFLGFEPNNGKLVSKENTFDGPNRKKYIARKFKTMHFIARRKNPIFMETPSTKMLTKYIIMGA